MNKTIRIKAKYKPLFKDSDKRYVLLTGGRNSAKSFTASLAEATALVQPVPHKTLYTRYTLSSAEISVIPEFQDKLEIANLSNQFHTTKSIITHRQTGNSIIFAGIKTSAGNQTAKLKSIPGLSRFVVDEAEEFRDEVAFDTIDFSVRSLKAANRVTLIMNPQDINHFVWAKWFDGYTEYVNVDGTQIPISRHPDLIHIHTTYLDNLEHIPKNYFDKIMFLREHNRPKYEHLFLGKWQEKAEGVVFANWVEGDFDESLPYAYGLDYGFFPDPLALVKVAVDNNAKRVYIHEELYQTQLSHGDTLRVIRQIVKGDEMVIHDTSEPRLSYDLGGMGINMQKAEKGPGSIAEGIKKMQDYTLVVTKDSHNIKKELNLYVWNDRKSSTPIDAHNHGMDATRYCFTRLAEGTSMLGFL